MEHHQDVSHAVSAVLKARGLSHAEVAARLGLSPKTVDNIISRGYFTQKRAKLWSRTFDIPVEVFLDGVLPGVSPTVEELVGRLNALQSRVERLEALLVAAGIDVR